MGNVDTPSLRVMVIARLGSKRVRDKAIRYLGDKLLVEYPLELLSGMFDTNRIYLNSPDTIFASIADKYSVQFYHRAESVRNGVQDDLTYDFFVHNSDCKYLLQVNLTSPFVTKEDVSEFLGYWFEHEFDALYSVKRVQIETIYKGEPVNFRFGDRMQDSQSLEPVYTFTSGLMMWERTAFMDAYEHNNGNALFSGQVGYYELSGASTLDIDYEGDFWLAEAILAKQMNGDTKSMYHTDRVEFDRKSILNSDGVVDVNETPSGYQGNLDTIIAARNGKTWSFDLANTPTHTIALISQAHGEGNREHMHPNADETWIIVRGTANVHIDDHTYHANPCDVFRIPRGTWHSIVVTSKQGVRISVNREKEAHVYRS